MSRDRITSIIFALSGVHDGALGVAFLIWPAALFRFFHVTPPNHYGYVQFPAEVLIIFGAMFFAVAAAPRRNRNLIPYGIGLKVAYAGTVFGYWLAQGLPNMWKPFAVIDVIFALLFYWSWRQLRAAT